MHNALQICKLLKKNKKPLSNIWIIFIDIDEFNDICSRTTHVTITTGIIKTQK